MRLFHFKLAKSQFCKKSRILKLFAFECKKFITGVRQHLRTVVHMKNTEELAALLLQNLRIEKENLDFLSYKCII